MRAECKGKMDSGEGDRFPCVVLGAKGMSLHAVEERLISSYPMSDDL